MVSVTIEYSSSSQYDTFQPFPFGEYEMKTFFVIAVLLSVGACRDNITGTDEHRPVYRECRADNTQTDEKNCVIDK